jgi:hypothetical protein
MAIRAVMTVIMSTIMVAVYMLVAPAVLEPLIETFLAYEAFLGTEESMAELQQVMFLWAPLLWWFGTVAIAIVWEARRNRVVGRVPR